jgi:hypothetical protein
MYILFVYYSSGGFNDDFLSALAGGLSPQRLPTFWFRLALRCAATGRVSHVQKAVLFFCDVNGGRMSMSLFRPKKSTRPNFLLPPLPLVAPADKQLRPMFVDRLHFREDGE